MGKGRSRDRGGNKARSKDRGKDRDRRDRSDDAKRKRDRSGSRDRRDRQKSKSRGRSRSGRRGSAPASKSLIKVRVDYLPGDMALEELRHTAGIFGKVLEVKMWKESDGGKTCIIGYDKGVDLKKALQKLDNRRVEGWEKRLKAKVIDD